ncbi:hypothetical protein I6A60_23035 [Frankia sp. AgB1.9]|uniref:hypothetical protein n=1 Tax=unclassified Frankia TaxID=2632575 RepID=UPI0035A87265|nr:hypothetical protein [Frankia sp. AgW1.1]MBL7550724.1 hypothetical protein [Frankia sp. AgB1.9]
MPRAAQGDVVLEGDEAKSAVAGMIDDGEAQPLRDSQAQIDAEAREQDLFHRARAEDVLHWQQYHRPISAESLG